VPEVAKQNEREAAELTAPRENKSAAERRNIKLIVAYDGAAYNGFQRQKNGVGVQNVLEKFLSRLCGEEIFVTGSGRTDAGVHARHQVVNFFTHGKIPIGNIARAGTGMLPRDICVLSAEEVPPAFNARKSALWKRYVYRARVVTAPDPFSVRYVWQLHETPDAKLLCLAAEMLCGTHDFSGYQSAGSAMVSPVKTVYAASWDCTGDYVFTVAGDGFVYHQVRNLVWEMLQVGLHRVSLRDFAQTLLARRGEFENSPAPPQGLYLDYVGYTPWKT